MLVYLTKRSREYKIIATLVIQKLNLLAGTLFRAQSGLKSLSEFVMHKKYLIIVIKHLPYYRLHHVESKERLK